MEDARLWNIFCAVSYATALLGDCRPTRSQTKSVLQMIDDRFQSSTAGRRSTPFHLHVGGLFWLQKCDTRQEPSSLVWCWWLRSFMWTLRFLTPQLCCVVLRQCIGSLSRMFSANRTKLTETERPMMTSGGPSYMSHHYSCRSHFLYAPPLVEKENNSRSTMISFLCNAKIKFGSRNKLNLGNKCRINKYLITQE
jgi:hypothetical protein